MNSVAPGAHTARHTRPSGVELPGASHADLPPTDAALCPRWGAHHWLKCRPRVDLPPSATPLCPRWGPDHWLKCRAAIREKLGLGDMQCPSKCVTFGRYGRLNNNVYQLVNTFMAYVEPSLVHPKPDTLNPQPETLNPQPSTLNSKLQNLAPYLKPYTLKPKP